MAAELGPAEELGQPVGVTLYAYRLELDGPSLRKMKASEATDPAAQPTTATTADGKPTKGAKK